MQNIALQEFIKGIPKAELHLHIEGTLEPELMFKIAKRNNIEIQYKNVEELREAYDFNNLQDFLDIYYQGAGVLINEEDFYDMTWAYLEKAHSQNVIHTEIFFDPQTHTARGVEFKTVISGINRAIIDGYNLLGISTKLIMCFLRHLSQEDAISTLNEALEYKSMITAVGLDSSELGYPPSNFSRVFEMAKENGLLTVVHAGEEGPSEYVWQALTLLKASRIDHGNRSLDDDKLIGELVRTGTPLTLCPLSNLKLHVVNTLESHPLKVLMEKGVVVTVNSDDPAYFGGYINENYLEISRALSLTKDEIVLLAKNSVMSSFESQENKIRMVEKIDMFNHENFVT